MALVRGEDWGLRTERAEGAHRGRKTGERPKKNESKVSLPTCRETHPAPHGVRTPIAMPSDCARPRGSPRAGADSHFPSVRVRVRHVNDLALPGTDEPCCLGVWAAFVLARLITTVGSRSVAGPDPCMEFHWTGRPGRENVRRSGSGAVPSSEIGSDARHLAYGKEHLHRHLAAAMCHMATV